jgi:hypothetical protein
MLRAGLFVEDEGLEKKDVEGGNGPNNSLKDAYETGHLKVFSFLAFGVELSKITWRFKKKGDLKYESGCKFQREWFRISD